MKKQPTNQAQDGNVLFIVLIAISLLVALTISLTSSERFSNSMDNERITFELQEIYQYAQSIERAVSNVLLNNGCEVLQLNFDHPDLVNYNTSGYYLNPNSPADKSCDLFEPEGGGVIYSVPPSMSQGEGGAEYGIIGGYAVQDIGTSAPELFITTRVSEEACFKINNDQDVENAGGNIPFKATTLTFPYTNLFTYPSSSSNASEDFRNIGLLGTSAAHAAVRGAKTFCLRNLDSSFYEFFHVILAR